MGRKFENEEQDESENTERPPGDWQVEPLEPAPDEIPESDPQAPGFDESYKNDLPGEPDLTDV